MPKFIQHKDIDQQKWDAVVVASPTSYVYGYSWYLNAVCDNWDAMVLGDYEAVLPLPNEKKMKMDTLYQPFFHHCLEVIGKQKLAQEIINSFWDNIPQKFKIQIFRSHTKLEGAQTWHYQAIENVADYDKVKSAYSTNVKRQLKLAVKNEFNYSSALTSEEFINMFTAEVGERLHFLESDYIRLSNLIEVGIQQGKFFLRSIRNSSNEITAVGVFILEKEKIIYLKGATNDEGRKNGAMQMLIDEAIKEWGSQHTFFDCGGSNVASVASFYKRFGAVDVEYYHYDKVKGKILKKLIDFKRKRSNHGG